MAIIGYVPPIQRIRDNRKPDGNYYIAKCDICDTEFYPKRTSAKYCTPNCGLIAHRQAIANGHAPKPYEWGGNVPNNEAKKKEYDPKDALKKGTEVLKKYKAGRADTIPKIYSFLKQYYSIHGLKNEIIELLKEMPTNSTIELFDEVNIRRLSPRKFKIIE